MLDTLVVGDEEGSQLGQLRIDEGLDPVGHWVVGVEYVEEPGAGGQPELGAQALHPSHRHEHTCGTCAGAYTQYGDMNILVPAARAQALGKVYEHNEQQKT